MNMDKNSESTNTNIISRVKDFVSDQDNNQKINATISVTLELYRVLASSLLILFVPQNCDGHLCTMNENIETDSQLYTTGLFFNFFTMFVFLVMYSFEIKRENRLITYLDVNKSKAADNDSVGNVLNSLPIDKRNSILFLDTYYQKAAYVAMISFVINSIISGIVVYEYSLGNQTTTTIITNILFMVTKLSDVYITVNTEKNIFYSAYLKGKIQYNDVDPDKIMLEVVELKDIVIEDQLNVSQHKGNINISWGKYLATGIDNADEKNDSNNYKEVSVTSETSEHINSWGNYLVRGVNTNNKQVEVLKEEVLKEEVLEVEELLHP